MNASLAAMGAAFPAHVTPLTLVNASVQGRSVTGVKLANASGSGRIPILFTGGVHSNEWAPPDALLSFVDKLARAAVAGTGLTYPMFTDVNGITYGGPGIAASTVQMIFDRFDLYVVPIVNPDGRDFTLSGAMSSQMAWRKNRRPNIPCDGVDINRNFPITWDPDTYYSVAATTNVNVSSNPCSNVYRGLVPASEPEVQNLVAFVATQGIEYLVDIHMSGRTILYPWGMETNQSTDSTKNFLNLGWDRNVVNPMGGRDGTLGTAYEEFIPNGGPDPRGYLLDRLVMLADGMATEVLRSAGSSPQALARSAYFPQQSVGLYPTTGAFDDYTFSQQFMNPALPNIHTFTLECGLEKGDNPLDPADDDGGFWPDFALQFPKVEREVHAALLGLLMTI
jgi:Zinc carboxypeptidase.